MKILINDFEENKEEYLNIFEDFGYEQNEFIFLNSFDACRNFIETYLEKNKLHLDLIISNDSKDTTSDILKPNELCYFKNNLTSSFSKGNFRISSIPIILYSKNDTKSHEYSGDFYSIVQKNSSGNHNYFTSECEGAIKNTRKLIYDDLDTLELKVHRLINFKDTNYFKNHYYKKVSKNADYYFAYQTKILSLEFIRLPAQLLYDWINLSANYIEKAIGLFEKMYRSHIKYDRNNGERGVLHDFFRRYKIILLRDSYSDLEYELNLKEFQSMNSQECDFILKQEYPNHHPTTFFEVKKEDVKFYVKKNTKRPQPSAGFLSHLIQTDDYKKYTEDPRHQEELDFKLGYHTQNFDFELLAGRLEEKEEMKHFFQSQLLRMFKDIKVTTYEELNDVNINYSDKFNRLTV